MLNILQNIHINVNPIPVLRNLIQGPSAETGAASKTETKHVGSHSRRSQDDTAGREGGSIEQEAPAQNMRPYPTDEEMRAKSTSHNPLSPTTPAWGKRQEVGVLPQAGVPENEMRTSAGSSRHLQSPAVHSLRSNFKAPSAVQGAGESRSTSRHRSYDTTHDLSQRHPAALPSVTRSMSSQMIARDNQNPEVEQLKKQLASSKRENEKWAAESKVAEVTIRDMKAALRAAKTEEQWLHDDLSKKKSENHSLRQEIEVSTGTSRSLGAKLQETESVLASTRQALDAATNQLKAMSEQKAQLHTLLNDRTFELKGAQSFLTTADTSSGADVISMLQRLNAEVLQSAAYMAESMVDTFSFESGGVVRNEAYEVVTGLFGQSLAHYLATKKHKDDPLLIQITFQSCFIKFLEIVICSLSLHGEDVNRVLGSTYERIRCGEAQAISGRWRALTNAYANNHEESQLIASFMPHLTGCFCNIMLAAGCSVAPDILHASVEKKLSDRVVLLFKLALQLNKIVMEEITSADLRTVTVPSETTYSAEQMEDAYVDGDPATGGVRVLCTTDIGLMRITRMATSGEKQWDDKLLLKPKVALKTVVDSMDG